MQTDSDYYSAQRDVSSRREAAFRLKAVFRCMGLDVERRPHVVDNAAAFESKLLAWPSTAP